MIKILFAMIKQDLFQGAQRWLSMPHIPTIGLMPRGWRVKAIWLFSIGEQKTFDKIQLLFIKMWNKAGKQGTYFNVIKSIYNKPVAKRYIQWRKAEKFLQFGKTQECTLWPLRVIIFSQVLDRESRPKQGEKKASKLEKQSICQWLKVAHRKPQNSIICKRTNEWIQQRYRRQKLHSKVSSTAIRK